MEILEKLDVYNLALQLSDRIWGLYNDWPDKVKHTIGKQVIRSADSISANIAEGFGRYTTKDRQLFYRYARGSFYESVDWILKLERRNVLQKSEIEKLNGITAELGPKPNGFIRSTANYNIRKS